jgi:DNA-binding transcriptional ArsR family regulator
MSRMDVQLDPVFAQEADICKAFAHPARLRVLDYLCDRERTVSDIKRELRLSGPNLSQHLRILKTAGVLKAVRRKGHVYCSCASPAVQELYCAMHRILKEQARQQFRFGA